MISRPAKSGRDSSVCTKCRKAEDSQERPGLRLDPPASTAAAETGVTSCEADAGHNSPPGCCSLSGKQARTSRTRHGFGGQPATVEDNPGECWHDEALACCCATTTWHCLRLKQSQPADRQHRLAGPA